MLHTEHRGDVAVVYMQHGKVNAMDIEFCERVPAELDEIAKDARAVVLTAQGSTFSAGVDLLRVLDEGPAYIKRFVASLNAFCESIFSLPRPLVAAVNGHAIAGGCILACLADRRIMARDAGRIGVPEMRVGLPFPPGPLEVMRFSVPTKTLAEVVYGGATYEPADALERGLVDEVVGPEELLDRAVEVAVEMAGARPDAFALTKALVRAPYLEQMNMAAAGLYSEVESAWTSEDTLAAVRDYVERTFKPRGR
jgi:enoyl-CoA hydratase